MVTRGFLGGKNGVRHLFFKKTEANPKWRQTGISLIYHRISMKFSNNGLCEHLDRKKRICHQFQTDSRKSKMAANGHLPDLPSDFRETWHQGVFWVEKSELATRLKKNITSIQHGDQEKEESEFPLIDH